MEHFRASNANASNIDDGKRFVGIDKTMGYSSANGERDFRGILSTR